MLSTAIFTFKFKLLYHHFQKSPLPSIIYLLGINNNNDIPKPAWALGDGAFCRWGQWRPHRELMPYSHHAHLVPSQQSLTLPRCDTGKPAFSFFLFHCPKSMIRAVVVEIYGSQAGHSWHWGIETPLFWLKISIIMFILWVVRILCLEEPPDLPKSVT